MLNFDHLATSSMKAKLASWPVDRICLLILTVHFLVGQLHFKDSSICLCSLLLYLKLKKWREKGSERKKKTLVCKMELAFSPLAQSP